MPISSSLFDTFSLHAAVTRNGSASLEIDIPRSVFRKEVRRNMLVLFIILFLAVLVLFSMAVALINSGDASMLPVDIQALVFAMVFAAVILYCRDFVKKVLWTSHYDIESNKEREVVLEYRSFEQELHHRGTPMAWTRVALY